MRIKLILAVGLLISMQATTAATGTYCSADGECPGLGDVFYLPNVNIYESTQQTSGQKIFIDTKIGGCANTAIVADSNTTLTDYTDKSSLTKAWSSGIETPGSGTGSGGVNLAYSGFSLAATGSTTISGSLTDTKDYKASSVDRKYINRTVSLKGGSDCWSKENIDARYLQAYQSLAAIDPADAGNDSGWQAYVDFLQSYGSHIQKQQTQGSRMMLWESTSATSSVSQDDVKAKACFDLGLSVVGSVGACANYNNSQKAEASTKDIKKKFYVLGGDDTTRNNVLGKVETGSLSQGELDAFIKSGLESDQPIGYTYIPVWQVLKQIYQPLCNTATKGKVECDNLQRALNLQAAYEGYLVWSCGKRTDNRTGSAYQQMVAKAPNTLGITTYACREAKAGCRNDKDCKTNTEGFIFTNTASYCGGASCITSQKIPGTADPILYRSIVKTNETNMTGSNSEVGVNASCSNSAPYGCQLDWSGGAQERDIWLETTNGPGEGNATEGQPSLKKTSSRLAANADATGETEEIRDHFDVKVQLRHVHSNTAADKANDWKRFLARLKDKSIETIKVLSSDGRINCPKAFCSGDYAIGGTVTLKVVVPKGYEFLGWAGEVCEEADKKSSTCTIKNLKEDEVIEALYR